MSETTPLIVVYTGLIISMPVIPLLSNQHEHLMEEFFLAEDILVICERAQSFPDGVFAAHQELHQQFPQDGKRRYFGLSWPDQNGKITYKAAVESLGTEEIDHSETFTIKSGLFITKIIKDFRSDVSQIESCFQLLLKQPNIDPNGYCLEMYINENDVLCMVPIIK